MIALVLGAFRQADYPTLPFALVSPGAAGVKRKTLGGDGTRNWTLAQVGLAPPAATLLVQWKGGKGGEDAVFPKVSDVCVLCFVFARCNRFDLMRLVYADDASGRRRRRGSARTCSRPVQVVVRAVIAAVTSCRVCRLGSSQ